MASHTRVRVLSLLIGFVATLSCEQVVVTTLDVDRVDVSPSTTFVRQAETARLNVTVLSRDGRTLSGRSVEWSSMNPGIATVDDAGMVRGVTPGQATIRALSEGVPGTASVTVTAGPAISATPQEVDFAAVQNGASPGDRTVAVTNAGDGTLNGLSATIRYTAGQPSGWLSASMPATAPATLVLSATQAGLALGSYTATVEIAASVASNSPRAVTVRLTVLAPQPAIALGATSTVFNAAQGGADPTEQNIGVTNAGGGSLSGLAAAVSYTSGQSAGWLNASFTSGTAPTTLRLRATTGSLVQGVYNAQVRVSSPTAQNSPQTVNVTFTVGAPQPILRLTPATLNFSGPKGGPNPTDSIIQITNAGAGSLTGLAISVGYPGGQPSGWVATQLNGATAPTTLAIGARTGTLDVGSYTASVTVTSPVAPNSPQRVDITFQVLAPPPKIAVDPNAISFSTTTQAGSPAPSSVAITNSGAGSLTGLTRSIAYGVGEPIGWLSADLASTGAPTTLALRANSANLTAGTYNAKVQVAATSASNTVDIAVTLTIADAGPVAPGPPTAVAVSESRINITWADRSINESRFDIQRSANGTTWAGVGSVPTNQTSFSDTNGLVGSTTYLYRVSACNSVTCAPNPTPASATTAPVAPNGLTAAAASATTINLKWNDNSPDETGFPVQRSTDGGQTWTTLGTAAANATSFSDTNANATTTYRYRVFACRNALCSGFSNEAQVSPTPPTPTPGAPTSLAATAVAVDRIDLTWGAATGTVTHYSIEQKTTAAGTYAAIGNVSGTTLSHQNTGLAAGTQYFYRVQACNLNGCSGYSNEASATTLPPPLQPPGAPSGLAATAVAFDRIDIAWGAASGTVTHYIIERKTTAAGTYSAIGNVPNTTLSLQNTGLTASTEYFYRVQACNSAGCSGFSNEAAATTLQPPLQPPGAPSGLAATAVAFDRIDIAWGAASGTVTQYIIERKTTAAGTYSAIGNVPNTTLSLQNTGLTASTEYFYRVQACNSAGCSGFSNEAAATTLPPPLPPPLQPPGAPSGLAATAVAFDRIDIAWGAASGTVTHYIIERKTTAAGTYGAIGNVPNTTLSLQNTGLTASTEYFYRVQACNSAGCSGFSNEASATTLAPPLLPPGAPGLTATAVSSSAIDLAWSAASGTVTRYRIAVRNNSNSSTFAVVDSVPGTILTYQSGGLSPLTSYSYIVEACNSAGCASSNIATATTQALTLVGPPSGVSANGVSVSQIDVSWSHSGLLVSSFDVERAPSTAPTNFALVHTAGALARSFSDTGLPSGTTYLYRVRACNLTGCSAWVGPASGTTRTPSTPTGVTATALSPTQVSVGWAAPGGQAYYEVRRRIGGSGMPTVITIGNPAATSFTDSSVASRTSYTYEVRACAPTALCSGYSAPATVITP